MTSRLSPNAVAPETVEAFYLSDEARPVATATDFVRALFAPDDTVLFRPIETWNEDGRKCSKVDYKGTTYSRFGAKDRDGAWHWSDVRIAGVIRSQVTRSVQTRCNIFFGVCP